MSAWENGKSIDAGDARGGRSISAGAGAAEGEEIFAYARALAFLIYGGQAWTDAAAKGEVGKDHRHRKTGLPLLTKDSSMGVEDNGKNTHCSNLPSSAFPLRRAPSPSFVRQVTRTSAAAAYSACWRNVDR
ncbi:hypothetical protein R3P38DRAFT_3239334 [Favolaschia claudopus]|uniref:Uncharacterized protein n=1 Tax=Favolaschia claudopus TaxID=2862362 RepID=A0AAV9Z8V3_9AGAR